MINIPIASFLSKYPGLSNRLVNKARIGSAISPNTNQGYQLNDFKTFEYSALWDTGATNSLITQKVVSECALSPIGIVNIFTPSGENKANSYFVSIWLPNRVCFLQVRVSEGFLAGDIDLLIGMDIMNQGDFVVNNLKGITTFSFRVPSLECIDLGNIPKDVSQIKQDPKDAPCPCGSARPFKDCHGKKTKRGRR